MRVKWIRDEVILALDVLFSTQINDLTMESPTIIELSSLLKQIPIIPSNKKSDKFRNAAGVSRQLSTFYWGLKNNKKVQVGKIFYEVYDEFKYEKESLHLIAQTIRQCIKLAQNITFLDEAQIGYFREGTLLAHIHQYFENKYESVEGIDEIKCRICSLKPQQIYSRVDPIKILRPHLLIPPECYRSDLKLEKKDFIIVCSICHNVLHQTRPWLSLDNIRSILKTI